MRSDMGKVVIERPRAGHDRCYGEVRNRKDTLKSQLKRLKIGDFQDEDFEDWFEDIALGGIESMVLSYHGYERKEFSDLLGPVYRYLQSKVGCQWDAIWSDVCRNLRGGYAIEHVREHVNNYVHRINDEYFPKKSIEDIKYGHDFYIDEEGILRQQIARPKENVEYKTVDSVRLSRKTGEILWRKACTYSNRKEFKEDDTYRYHQDEDGNEFVFVHDSWFTFDYRNLKDIAENSGDGVTSFWENNIGPDDKDFTGVRFIKYQYYDILGNQSSVRINSNVSRNFKFRWKFRQASHAEIKRAGLSNVNRDDF